MEARWLGQEDLRVVQDARAVIWGPVMVCWTKVKIFVYLHLLPPISLRLDLVLCGIHPSHLLPPTPQISLGLFGHVGNHLRVSSGKVLWTGIAGPLFKFSRSGLLPPPWCRLDLVVGGAERVSVLIEVVGVEVALVGLDMRGIVMGGVEEGSQLLVGNLHYRRIMATRGVRCLLEKFVQIQVQKWIESLVLRQRSWAPTLQEGQRDLDVGKTKELESNLSAGMGNQKEDNQGTIDVAVQGSGSSTIRGEKDRDIDKRPANLAQESGAGEIPYCDRCRTYGHLARDCRRGLVGNTQLAEVRDLPVSEYIAPLCAAQVDGQAFFCIPDRPSEVHARERSTTAIVTFVKGVVTARQVEEEFARIHPKTWRWTARKVADNMFTVRFPNAQIIAEWECFNPIC
jgi:hypothetical protein